MNGPLASGRRAGLMALVLVAAAAAVGGSIWVLHPGTPTAAGGVPHFVDETAASGLDMRYDGDATYQVGGGVAIFDCNGDRKPDLYVAGGAGKAALFRNDSPVGGALRFTQLTDPATDLTGVNGAYPIDIDGDGITDLVVLRAGGSTILRGLGNCRFAPADDQFGFTGVDGDVTAFSAKWEGSATLPTLAIGRYLTLGSDGKVTQDCADNSLFRPAAGGTSYGPPIALTPGYCTLSMLFSDWDRSGRRDLRITNDRHYYVDGSDQLWRVATGQSPRAYTADDGWVSMQIWGMGIASYDATGDGYPDVYLTSQGDNKLQTLTTGPSQPAYRDIALKRGVTATEPYTGGDVLPSTAWHPEFQDVNNDGFVDLFVSKGNVSAQPDFAQRDPSNLLLGQPDGTFREAGGDAGIATFDRGRGAGLADFNSDGLLDLVLVNYGADVRVWRNVGGGTAAAPQAMGNWLALDVQQPGANRDAIGAWLEVKIGDSTIRRELTIGGGHVGGQLGWTHIGIGSAGGADVRVTWPDGEVGPWQHVGADRFSIIERGANAAQTWTPGG